MKKIIIFEIKGKRPLDDWIESLKDKKTIARISERLGRLMVGYYGDFKKIDNELSELRLSFGAGYRIYFSEQDNVIVVLLCGGDKSTQSRDIKKAKEYLQIWKGNNNE
jgi:putative addiction module killer protein